VSAHAASMRGSWEAFITLLYMFMVAVAVKGKTTHQLHEGSQSDCPEF
jgi:hypothetical protein